MPDLPEVRERFVADTTGYSRPLREAAQDADKFSRQNDQAALAARRMGLAAKDAADKAARAQKDAADAAERLAKGEIKADEAARAAARAENELERASIKAAEAQRATANAADKAAAQYRQVARDADLAATAQMLGALKASGSTRQYNEVLRQARVLHGDLSKTAVAGFKAMEHEGNLAYQGLTAASQGLADVGPLWVVGIANALTLLPAAASVAGGGITLAMGGALAGLGIMAQAKAADVKRAFSNMKTSVVGELKQISAPFHDTLLHVAMDAKLAFASMAPALQGAFASMGPAVTRFAASFAGALGRLNPMISSLGTAFSSVLDALGPQMGQILNNIGTGFKAIFDAVSSNPAALGNFVTGLSQVIRGLGDGIGVLIRFSSEFRILANALGVSGGFGLLDFANGVQYLGHALTGTTGSLQVVEQTFPSFQQQAIASAVATQQLMTAQQAAALTSKQLKTALDALTGANQNAFDATTSYRTALVAADAAAKKNNAGIDGMGKAALANRSALSTLAGAIRNVMENANPTSSAIATMRSRFIAAAEGMHVSHAAAIALADKLLGVTKAANTVPKSKATHVTAPGALVAAAEAYRVANAVRSIPTNWHTNYTFGSTFGRGSNLGGATGGLYEAGKRFRYADGGEVSGLVTGPGTGTSDSIMAPWLSNKEFVVNSKATAENLPLLMAINSGKAGLAKGGMPKASIIGGGWSNGTRPPTKAELAAQHRVSLARARPEYLAAMAAQQQLEAMRRTVYGGWFNGATPSPGSAHGTVVQHSTNVYVTVQGSVTTVHKLAADLQGILISNRMPVALPEGR